MSKKDLTEKGQYSESQVICPYCGYEPDECYPRPNGDWETEECPSCEKKFRASASIDYSSEKDCELNGLVCQFQPDDTFNFIRDEWFWSRCSGCQTLKRELREEPKRTTDTATKEKVKDE